MKSVGEAMSIGRTFKEALQKALRSLEIDSYGFETKNGGVETSLDSIRERLQTPNAQLLWYVAEALRMGMDVDELYQVSQIDPWFLDNIAQIIAFEKELQSHSAQSLAGQSLESLDPSLLRRAKQMGFSDVRLGRLLGVSEDAVRAQREQLDIIPVYKTVDTCAAEFVAHTPYLYSTYEEEAVTIPTTPPYSSTTIAIWTRRRCISWSRSSTSLVSGT